ncbi:hypothetical protein [Streptomyces sp. VRA16 Mangrove soil]|uniref:hypothetical protein n=1 Tax=Streptomyces sp. VRA16 Mangrove soil TaxID=2817434 RepID=UPI001A9F89CD|nr:hypothetical protein [Streptomyces sp. VRA16 Mangrove soil]MBO1336368.1 hypothetical protein [Streptomyces sp. VRA16 Mangrove soil]
MRPDLDLTDDPVQQRLLRKALEVFREGGRGPVLQEMAREVLAGRVGLREATRIPAYAEAVIEQGQEFRRRWESMPDSERAALAREGERQVAEERALMAAERAERGRV